MKKLILFLVVLLIATFPMNALAIYAITVPDIVPARSVDDFIGTWQLSGASVLDMLYFSAEELDLSGYMEITDAHGHACDMEITEDEMTFSFLYNGGFSDWELLDDGTLAYTIPDGSSEGIPSLFCLRDDGTISTDVVFHQENGRGDGGSIVLTVYFTRE